MEEFQLLQLRFNYCSIIQNTHMHTQVYLGYRSIPGLCLKCQQYLEYYDATAAAAAVTVAAATAATAVATTAATTAATVAATAAATAAVAATTAAAAAGGGLC